MCVNVCYEIGGINTDKKVELNRYLLVSNTRVLQCMSLYFVMNLLKINKYKHAE